MDNSINSNYGNMRVTQSQVQRQQELQQSDVQPREVSDELHYDPAEQLGRSQLLRVNLPSAQKPVKLQNIDDILSDEHIDDKTADEILMQFGFSAEECAALRKQYPALNAIAEALKINVDNKGDLEDDSKEGIKEIIEGISQEPVLLKNISRLSNKNMQILKEKFGLDEKKSFGFLGNLFDDYDKVNTLVKISLLTGKSLEDIAYDYCYNIEDYKTSSNEQLFAMKQLTDEFGNSFSIYNAGLIEDPKLITPRFIDKFGKQLEILKKQKISIQDVKQDPVTLLRDIENMNAVAEKYNIDFSNIVIEDKFDKVQNLLNLPFAEKSAEFIAQCNNEVKEQSSDTLMDMAANEDFMQNPKVYSNLLNTISKVPNNGMIYNDLLRVIKEKKLNVSDIESMTKVAQACADIGYYFTDSQSAHPLLAYNFKTGERKYDECVKFIHKIAEFYNCEGSEYPLKDYMSQVFRGVDYEHYEECLDKLKDLGLYGKINPWDMKEMLENANSDVVFDTIVKYKNNPIVNGAGYLFNQFDHKKIDAFYQKVCESIKEMNPDYSDMDVNDMAMILRSYSSLCHDFYNKLQFGYGIKYETLDINKVLEENKKFDCKEYAQKFFTTDFPNINIKDKIQIFSGITSTNKDTVFDILQKGSIPKEKLIKWLSSENKLWLGTRDYDSAQNIVDRQKEIVLENPDKYVNGEYSSKESMIKAVNYFFETNNDNMTVLASATDKETVNHLLRMRFDDAKDYLREVNHFGCNELDMLNKLSNSVNIDGKPFLPAQKIGFIDLIKAYESNNLSTDKIQEMVDLGKVDFGALNFDLFNQIMKNAGMSDEEIASIPKEKLVGWDMRYIHLLAKEINEEKDVAFADILRADNLSDFKAYIQDTSNRYGQTNEITRQKFADMGMDYEKWLNPSSSNEVHFVGKDNNQERFSQIENQFLEDINTLRQGPVKGFIDKQFPKCIKEGEFFVPTENRTSPAALSQFIENVKKALEPVWKRAEGNAQSPDSKRSATARNTLMILDHLNQRVEDLKNCSTEKIEKSMDVKIKMWDRVPQKDIFQGNYSTCCIGMGGGNGTAMPYYLMNTAFNMIEMIDNNTGKTMGNALCFFAKDDSGNPIFVIDNIEINNALKPSEKMGAELRDSIVQYVSNVAKEITGRDNVQIVLGDQYNDVPYEDLPSKSRKIEFLGDISRDDIYSDLYKDWVDKEDLNKFTAAAMRILK